MIKFQDADIGQVLDIYQELTGRTVLKPSSLPATKVSIKTQTELSRTEAIQALDSILSMNGIAMVPQGTKFVKAVAEAAKGKTPVLLGSGVWIGLSLIGVAWIAMEWVEGKTLRETLLEADGPLPLRDALTISRQIARPRPAPLAAVRAASPR